MKSVPSRSTALVALLVSAALAASPREAFAQATTNLVIRNYRNKADLEKGTEQGWAAVVEQCGRANDACAAAANAEVTAECAADAQLFSKHTKNWKVLGFALIIASAGFTGAGAASTIAGSTTIPKIFSTLGGTTGLGAVTATVNSNVVSDQAGLAAIDTELTAWLAFLQTGKPNLSAPPTAAQIYQAARTYIALCAAPAMASNANSDQPAGH
jgi:hypothetical protein